MSHLTKVTVKIKSLEAIANACQRLGFEFRQGQRTYAWYGRFMGDAPLPEGMKIPDLGKCDHAIRCPGASYEIGLVQQGDHYNLTWDTWASGGLAQLIGEHGEKLVQAYAVEAAREEASRQGYSCWEEQLEDGDIRLHVQVGG